MKRLHIINGDAAGECLKKSGTAGEVLVWRDILYDGPRVPGWPDTEILRARALFLEETTAGGVGYLDILESLKNQYGKLETATESDEIVLWFDACLYDQSMLCHILTCLSSKGLEHKCSLICVDHFPGIEPFNGLGQLDSGQLASLYPTRQSVTGEQFHFAEEVDRAFALQDQTAFFELANVAEAPLPWVPAAVTRWLQEQPDEAAGLGLLEHFALEAVQSGCQTPGEIFAFVSARDTSPQYWGDITLWKKINNLAERNPPLVKIEGPTKLLPQWDCQKSIRSYKVYPLGK
ncbi:DUF1835 domain-containing protein [Geomonas sp. Red32]|uniref:DUF1835 domain-containing protein n=1 Tax=Geomonas sp. Red32 TaxID=2912856 RepID=UPI00202CBE55|nr:DUF1835 domain-containing protein [Geomonas sp. Red32]MCM0082629.1 DUF1835 domain-containing protein [Geomonas sp. Red32]